MTTGFLGRDRWAKAWALNDVVQKVLGKIDTPELFEEHRQDMAFRVWRKMVANDSRECRACHDYEIMDLTTQERRAGKRHQKAIDKDMTCIQCHQGIAHELPEDWEEAWEEEFQTEPEGGRGGPVSPVPSFKKNGRGIDGECLSRRSGPAGARSGRPERAQGGRPVQCHEPRFAAQNGNGCKPLGSSSI